MIHVRTCDESDAAAWDDFVRQARGASVYHLWHWRRVLGTHFGHEPFYLAAWVQDRIRGVLPIIALERPWTRPSLHSLPFVNRGGVVADDPSVAEALVDQAVALAQRIGASRLEFRHRAETVCRLPARTHRVSMVRRLPPDRERLWKEIGPKLRNQVRKADRSGLVVEQGSTELVADFHHVFVHNMKRLGSPTWGRDLFEEVTRTFPDRARIFVVRFGTLPVAAGLVLWFQDTVEVPWASSLRPFDHLCGNVRLYWQMLAEATEAGFDRFDLGRCAPGSPQHRFKRHWGAEEVPLAWHTWPAPPAHEGLETHRDTLADLWRKLPLWATRILGPPVRRLLPQ